MHVLGILLALTSAVVWGSGDFSGGLAARRNNQFQVLALTALSGMAVLVILAVLLAEPLPSPASMGWAALAGAAGALGVAALYRGLALGRAATVAPTAAVVGATLPVLFAALTEGLPGTVRLAGMILAIGGIWLVSGASAPAAGRASRPVLALALVAGAGFGAFFILIAQVESGAVFTPLVIARSAALAVALLLLLARRIVFPSPAANPLALLAGLLDAGGNIFYLLAAQFTRLDIAVVLASLYPASTVLLAYFLLKEDVSRPQWLGVALCLAAVALIAV